MNGFFGLGSKRDLDMTDLYQTLPNDKSKSLGDAMATTWQKELSTNKPSLRRTIVRQFGAYYMLVGMLAFVEECFTRWKQLATLNHNLQILIIA
jgi:hypothetical protein